MKNIVVILHFPPHRLHSLAPEASTGSKNLFPPPLTPSSEKYPYPSSSITTFIRPVREQYQAHSIINTGSGCCQAWILSSFPPPPFVLFLYCTSTEFISNRKNTSAHAHLSKCTGDIRTHKISYYLLPSLSNNFVYSP